MQSVTEEYSGDENGRFNFAQFPEEIKIDDELTLSSFVDADAEALAAITDQDGAVQRFIPWASEDKHEYIKRVEENRDLRGPRYGIRLNGTLAGHIAIFPSHDTPGVIELGYILAKSARGRHVIDRALPVCEELLYEQIPMAKLALCINDDNFPSQMVAMRNGYVPSERFSDGDRMYFKADRNVGQTS